MEFGIKFNPFIAGFLIGIVGWAVVWVLTHRRVAPSGPGDKIPGGKAPASQVVKDIA